MGAFENRPRRIDSREVLKWALNKTRHGDVRGARAIQSTFDQCEIFRFEIAGGNFCGRKKGAGIWREGIFYSSQGDMRGPGAGFPAVAGEGAGLLDSGLQLGAAGIFIL